MHRYDPPNKEELELLEYGFANDWYRGRCILRHKRRNAAGRRRKLRLIFNVDLMALFQMPDDVIRRGIAGIAVMNFSLVIVA